MARIRGARGDAFRTGLTRLFKDVNPFRKPEASGKGQYGSSEVRYMPLAFPVMPEPPRSEPMPPLERSGTSLDVRERARRYPARVKPAIAGQHGDLHTYRVCCRITRGFALDDQDAYTVLNEWNARCVPPWNERELVAKIVHARKYGRERIGDLRSKAESGSTVPYRPATGSVH
jgi:hypothetical protein